MADTRSRPPRGRDVGQAQPRPAPTRVSPAREAAFDVLLRVATGDAHSDDLLHGPKLSKLSQPDRDLTTALVLGVLRWQIALDARVRPLLSRPDLKLAEPVAITLRLGAFQLLHLERIPAHAALNESVELIRAAGHPHAAGMVNAILRKLVNAPVSRKPLVEPVEAMADRLGHPLWLVRRWVTTYGRARTEAICAFDQQEPPCGDLFPDDAESTPMPVMDAGSRLVAELAAASGPNARTMWDCCAAPGGKTLVLARRLPAAKLLATDANPARLRRLEQRLARELPASSFETAEADVTSLASSSLATKGNTDTPGLFDLILCDVPCSGTGTLARNPEIRHRLKPADLSRQAERQRRILHGALRHLAPGGRLLYSTCSLEPEENEAVVNAVLGETGTPVHAISVRPFLEMLQQSGRITATPEQIAGLVSKDSLRTLPGNGFQGDGFFATLLERAL